jgi:hypothetical protein
MTSYGVHPENECMLIATWADLPIKCRLPVGPFAEVKMATTAKSVLNAASRYRWHRALQLLEQGIFTEEEVGSDAAAMEQPAIGQLASDSDWGSDETEWLPRLPTSVVLGNSPMSEYLRKTIEGIVPDPVVERLSVGPNSLGFTGSVPLGNLKPLLWRDWSSHLSAEEHTCLAAELDADAAATTGLLVGRARQIAWYLTAELLVDKRDWMLGRQAAPSIDAIEKTEDFQRRLAQLLSDLTGLRVDWDINMTQVLLRVHTPKGVVVFWLEPQYWCFGLPDPKFPTWTEKMRLMDRLPKGDTVGGLASFIAATIAKGLGPF